MTYFTEWFRAAGIRALKTFAQALAAEIGSTAVSIVDLSWPQMLGIATTAALLSMLTSIAGLPEVKTE